MTVPPLDRKLLAILAADVVGYSKAMEADEAGTIARLRAIRAELTDPAIARHHGRIVKLMGDGALVAFDSVVDAVVCAAEIQKAVAARNAGLPEPERIVFRIGVNLGDVALVDGDVYGDGVNVAARLEQLAEPGGVMVSGTAYDHLQGKLDWPLDFVGEQQVKNISRPVRMYRLRLDGKRARRPLLRSMPRWAMPVVAALVALAVVAGAWQFWPADMASAKPSIAVLPFNNYGGDEATGRLADGLTEDIITDLSRVSEIDVIARNSTEVYKGKPADVRQIGRDLNVRYVLEGSIQRQGERIRATAQLIDAQTGAHVWSEQLGPTGARRVRRSDRDRGQHSQPVRGEHGSDQECRTRRCAAQAATESHGLRSQSSGGREAAQPDRERASRSRSRFSSRRSPPIRATPAPGSISPGRTIWLQVTVPTGRPRTEQRLEAAERAVVLDPNDAEAHAVLGHMLGFQRGVRPGQD